MKAIMSDRLRKILRDRQQARDLNRAVSKLSSQNEVKALIGGKNYKIRFISPNPDRK